MKSIDLRVKAAVLIAVFILSIFLGGQLIHVSKANGVWMPTAPNTDQPALIVQSPIEGYTYAGNIVPLNITLTKPASWGLGGNPNIYYKSGISYIHYIIDGTTYSLFEAQLINPIPQDMLPTISNFSASLKGLTNGPHSLQVIVYALNQWCPNNGSDMGTSVPPFYFHNMTVESEKINFATTETTSTPTSMPQPTVAMPLEYINYTITNINGTLWAEIDGDNPIYILNSADSAFDGNLPMVYPMPPGTTNIHVTVEGKEFSWINYTATYPEATHLTAIGDWWMVYTQLSSVSNFFHLKIHYEHPIEIVNESYVFLYDLNISPYLSQQSNDSTAYFTICMEINATNPKVYTAQPGAKWSSMNYTITKGGSTNIVTVQMVSEYSKSLPGDLIVTFSSVGQVPELQEWTVSLMLITIASMGLLVYFMKHKYEKIH